MSTPNHSPTPPDREMAANAANPPAASVPHPATTGPHQTPTATTPQSNTTGPHQQPE